MSNHEQYHKVNGSYPEVPSKTGKSWNPVQKKTVGPNRHPESQAFKDTLDAMLLLHDRKQKDYGTKESPFANIQASEAFGIPSWIGCGIRANDKMRRIMAATKQWLDGGTVAMANESLDDAWLDLANYAIFGYLESQRWNSK